MAVGEGHHAITPARDDQGLQLHLFHYLLGRRAQRTPIIADPHPQRHFDLGLVGRGRGHTGIFQHAISRIEHHGHSAQAAFVAHRIQDRRSGCTIAVV